VEGIGCALRGEIVEAAAAGAAEAQCGAAAWVRQERAFFVSCLRSSVGDMSWRIFFNFNTFFKLILNLRLFFFPSRLILLVAPIAMAWPKACVAPCMVAR